MSFPFLSLFLAAGLLLSLVGGVLFLWLGAVVAKMSHVTLPRIVSTVIFISLFDSAMVVAAMSISTATQSLWAVTAINLLFAALTLIAPWLWIRWRFCSGLGQAALAWSVTLIGTVVMNFPLALAISYYAVHAFVVPTGGMAPTIMGQHADFTCKNCGARATVSTSFLFSMARGAEFSDTVAVRCPNCSHPISVTIGELAAASRSGDRVTANKLVRPRRWDVVVFRYPEDPSQSYVKRLVGLPGETLQIREGDVFADGVRLTKAPGQCPELWLPVHDTAHTPQRHLPDTRCFQPSQSGNGWRQVGGQWRYAPRDTDMGDLEFSQPVTDELAYNLNLEPPGAAAPPSVGVRDVKLACRVASFASGATLRFVREHGPWRWEATISDAGEVRLEAARRIDLTAGGDRGNAPLRGTAEHGRLARPPGDDRWLALAVRDGQAYVLEDGQPVALLQFGAPDGDQATEAEETDDPDPRRDDGDDGAGESESSENGAVPGRIAVSAAGGPVTLARIVLQRDVYYLSMDELERRIPYFTGTPHLFPYALAADEYFFLGDNSPQSKDSRFWGGARRDALQGSVDYIYWPPERWRQLR